MERICKQATIMLETKTEGETSLCPYFITILWETLSMAQLWKWHCGSCQTQDPLAKLLLGWGGGGAELISHTFNKHFKCLKETLYPEHAAVLPDFKVTVPRGYEKFSPDLIQNSQFRWSRFLFAFPFGNLGSGRRTQFDMTFKVCGNKENGLLRGLKHNSLMKQSRKRFGWYVMKSRNLVGETSGSRNMRRLQLFFFFFFEKQQAHEIWNWFSFHLYIQKPSQLNFLPLSHSPDPQGPYICHHLFHSLFSALWCQLLEKKLWRKLSVLGPAQITNTLTG